MGKSIEWKMDSCGKAAIIYREGEQYALSQVVNGYFEQKQRIEELEGALSEYHGASAWIHHWMLAEKYRKPDVPALVESAKVKYRRTLARIAELEAVKDKRIEELEGALAAFEDWASPMTEGDYGRGLPDILSQARKALEERESQ